MRSYQTIGVHRTFGDSRNSNTRNFYYGFDRYLLAKFQMNTALSEISAQIKVGNGIFTQNSQTPVEARLQAKLAIGDIIRVLPEYDNYTRGLLLSTGFLSNISMNGKLGDLNLEKADISLPGTFVCQATGNVQNLHIADRINGSLQWELRLKIRRSLRM